MADIPDGYLASQIEPVLLLFGRKLIALWMEHTVIGLSHSLTALWFGFMVLLFSSNAFVFYFHMLEIQKQICV